MSIEQLTLFERPSLQLPPDLAGSISMTAGSLSLNSTVVVGMQLRERPEMYLRGYRASGEETRRSLPLIASHARRWAEFFTKHMASMSDHVHNSEEIIRYVLGMDIVAVHAGGPWPPLQCVRADRRNLKLGKGYLIADKSGQGDNLVYGIDDPARCLGSLSTAQPLIVAPTHDLMELYDCERIDEIIPRR